MALSDFQPVIGGLTDTHAHLDDRAFAADLPAVLSRAQAAGLTGIVTVGTDVASSRAAVALAGQHPLVWAAVGVHPHDARTLDTAGLAELRRLAQQPRVVAIGETGLDFYRNLSPRDVQLAAFRAQLSLAQELGLPVIVHDREAHAETMGELRRQAAATQNQRLCGVLHCFSGDSSMADEAVALGFHISVAGVITYRNAGRLAEVVRRLPLERLVLETDCPYLPPEAWRGQRNEPAYVGQVAQTVAQLRGQDTGAVVVATTRNAKHLFRWGKGLT
jgi:TatD DNase family protein